MNEDSGNHVTDLPDDLDSLPISDGEKQRIVSAMIKMMEMGMAGVYGLEDEGVKDSEVDCKGKVHRCKARCCSYKFALTKEEVEKGIIRHDKKRPFFIERDDDGYCSHLERKALKCTIWKTRPSRCRKYDCEHDPLVWPDRKPGM